MHFMWPVDSWKGRELLTSWQWGRAVRSLYVRQLYALAGLGDTARVTAGPATDDGPVGGTSDGRPLTHRNASSRTTPTL